MARMRVHELAKELKMTTKELMEKMLEMGIPVKNHMSTVSSSDVAYVRKHFKKLSRKTKVLDEKIEPGKVIRRRRKRKKEDTVVEASVSETAESENRDEKTGVAPSEERHEELPITPEEAVTVEDKQEEPPEKTPKVPEEEEVHGEKEEAVPEEETSAEEVAEAGEVSETLHDIEKTEEMAKSSEIVQPAPDSETKEEIVQIDETSSSDEVISKVPESKTAFPEEPVEKVEKRETLETVSSQPVQEEAEKVSEDKDEDKEGKEEKKKTRARRPRKRRRKRSRKGEPAKVIQLPELIPETEEEAREEDLEAKVRIKLTEEPSKKTFKSGKKFKSKVSKDEEEPTKGLKEVKKAEKALDESTKHQEKPSTPSTAPPKASKRRVKVEEAITVGDLAKQMGVKANEVIKKLLLLGLPVTVNQAIDFDTASLVASEFGFEVEKKGFEEEEILQTEEDKPEDLRPRPPVVTIMGHVDHGKTSLLDAIRHTNVTAQEAGGITQHIGAYHVKLENGEIVFLDTPGHEAFTAMRARGANVTDIVVLVVAADDGVMQQTVEAINHAKAAGVSIIVAINKIDKPNANPERVKRELAEYGLIPEEWGGDTVMVEVSAKKKIGIDDLLEMILLQAELMELKANPNKPARGRVIEAKLEKGRGPVATVLVQTGTLRVGDSYVCGLHYGRARSLFDDKGKRVKEVGPAMPVEVIGISGVPQAGDDFAVVADEKQAKMIAEHRQRKHREKELSKASKVTLEKLYEQIKEGELKELNIVLKTDVHGSLEALSDAIGRLKHPDIKINIIHAATGSINETDIMLASASNAIVIGFNVRPDAKVESLAEREHVDVRFYNVIYQVINDIKDAMAGLLEPEYKEKVLGRAEVRQTFHISKVGTVAGCYVTDGVVQRNASVRVLRDQVVVYDGKIASLKRFKDDVKEVKAGFECGILIENFNDVKVGDVLEAYVLEEIKPTIDVTDTVGEDSKSSE